jgi:ligand-binding SRPBCC domain-containing protein
VPHLHLVTEIAAPPEICFDLVLNVSVQRSLGKGMQAVGGVQSGPLKGGDTVTWRARHFWLYWRMTSEITEVDRPRLFRDEMLRGPFASWQHCHEFQQIRTGTRMIDEVSFTAPFGPLGWLAERLVLEPYLRNLLETRNRDLKMVAEREAAA